MSERTFILLIDKELSIVKNRLMSAFKDPTPQGILLDFISVGSKYIRSKLAILYLKSQEVEITDEIYEVLCAGELIHSASLLHDDVIDDANVRRGKETISKSFSPKVSILAGDYLLSYSIDKLLNLKKNEILHLFKKTIQLMCEAEFKQYFSRNKMLSEVDYIQICKGKTGELFASILEACSLILGLDSQKAKDFGREFGLYFQVKNDLDKDSMFIDKQNGIYTAKDILGIEKTCILLDNLKIEILNLIKDFPENIYKKELEGLVNSL